MKRTTWMTLLMSLVLLGCSSKTPEEKFEAIAEQTIRNLKSAFEATLPFHLSPEELELYGDSVYDGFRTKDFHQEITENRAELNITVVFNSDMDEGNLFFRFIFWDDDWCLQEARYLEENENLLRGDASDEFVETLGLKLFDPTN